MEYVWFALGICLLLLSLNISGFFKIIVWAGSVLLMLYALPQTELLEFIPEEEKTACSLFVIGIIDVCSAIVSVKFLGVEVFREISDIVIHILGIGLIITGICMACL